VTIMFNAYFVGGMSSNLANRDGVVSNGMKWGIVVDTNGNGIAMEYGVVALTPGASVPLNLTAAAGGGSAGDQLVLAMDLTSDSSQDGQAWEGDQVTFGGNGGVSGIGNVQFINGVTTGQKFWLVWFDDSSPGVMAGFLGSPEFVIPPDGHVVTYADVFVGVDPVRTANVNVFGFPEPSTLLLGMLGGLGLLRRRR
jgi:hypothetical protein